MVTSLISELKEDASTARGLSESQLLAHLKSKIRSLLVADQPLVAGINPLQLKEKGEEGPLVIMVVGVNGVGKTTTVAKLAHNFKQRGAKVMLAAADTFRAAAVEQLKHWGEKISVPVICGMENAKPATVAYDAMLAAKKENFDVLIIDTAGRLHNKSNLMQELEGVKNAIARHQPNAPHETILVVDGATGQNAVSQAREFNSAVPLTGVIVTKLDGTPKGGIVVAIQDEFGIPVRYIGVGESKDALKPFIADEFVEALFSTEGSTEASLSATTGQSVERRRRRADDTASRLDLN